MSRGSAARGAAVRRRIRARPVDGQGRLSRGRYVRLEYDPAEPFEVRLSETRAGGGYAAFSRDILLQAMGGTPAGQGRVRARLCYLGDCPDALLVLAVDAGSGPREFALGGRTAAAFLRASAALVPPGSERVDVPDTVRGLLGPPA